MQRYNPKEIEPRWQKKWAEDKTYEVNDDSSKPKKYVLEYFPYPSGAAMHVGHVRNYTIGDAISRHARMCGYSVLHPMGWDAFGLPAENYAIKTGISPQQAITQNTGKFKQQLSQMGFGYDWSREFASSDPNYYKWTQWFFLLLLKRGLAYRKESLQWWCPVDKTVLANEQVENGVCWRCGSQVEKKALKQWFFKITEYADRLAKDLDDVNWSDSIKNMQRNWIGRSKGAEIHFAIEGAQHEHIDTFTTRIDTIFGATFLVVAPEHPIIKEITTPEQKQAVEQYIAAAKAKSDIERQETNREKTGVFTGAFVLNPMTEQRIPVWVADYVLYGYGTGAIMAVPAHDERDHEFAEKFGLPIVKVVDNGDDIEIACTTGEGMLINSPDAQGLARMRGPGYNGVSTSEARELILTDLEEFGDAELRVNYKMHDWLISRQRYWGAPIPIIHCQKCGEVPVPEKDLPVVLPNMESYEPSGDGRSPLARVPEFVHTTCPDCGGPAERETDTMDGFACSSWYFLRFADPHNTQKPFDPKKIKHWLPVDDYIGGAEHAVMHLLYARMWTKVMYDEGLIDFNEPFKTLRNHGMILAPDGQKMSKSKGNVIAPDELIEQGYGADAIRIMELFIGPWNQAANWSVEGMGGAFRFLQRVWTTAQEFQAAHQLASKPQAGQQNIPAPELEDTDNRPEADGQRDEPLLYITHRTIKKVSHDLENLSFNTAIAAMMEMVNELYKIKTTLSYEQASDTWRWSIETLLQLLAPFAPHITEELWAQLGRGVSIHQSEWPAYDEKYLMQQTMTIVVQVNGKVRANLEMPVDSSESDVLKVAESHDKVQSLLADKSIQKRIYVPGKLVSFVIK